MVDGKKQYKQIILTGPAGSGKTATIRQLAQLLSQWRVGGFYTEEVRNDDKCVGYQAKTFDGKETRLSSIHHKSWISVGAFGVDVLGFEQLVVPQLEQETDRVDIMLIDEIGKMACHCPRFVTAVETLLDKDMPLVATVSLHGKGLIQEIKSRPNVKILTLTPTNCKQLLHGILGTLKI